ncbi:MAG TPA: uroporphyrinogen-III synthase [Kofleriaceae bacterium]|jgi:uroporphyrinogen-III synthase
MPHAVLTRSAIDRYAAALAPLGLGAIAMPVTRAVRRSDAAAVIAAALGGCDAVFVASREAAAALGEVAIPVFAVGGATAEALPSPAAFVGAADGVALAAEVVARVRGRVLVVCGSDRRQEPIDALRAGGLAVAEAVVYDTVPQAADPAALRDAAVCIVFAPSQVAALAAVVELRALGCAWVAIGPTTAAALAARGVAAAVAEAPTPEGVAAAVRAVYPPSR